MNTVNEISATYFSAWKDKDFDTLRSILADDVTFDGPLASLDNADDCVAGLRGMSEILADLEILKVAVDGPDVITWFRLHTTVAEPAPTVNWQTVVDGKISAIRVVFDPRQLVSGG
ncbi:nuclear transport factor 2 family protein [Williamsia sp. M5A3_1d]